MERTVCRTVFLALIFVIFCQEDTAKAVGSTSPSVFPDIKKINVRYVGSSAEISFDIQGKRVKRGWNYADNKPEIWTASFRGWNLSWVEFQSGEGFELTALLDAPSCQDELGDYCRYSSYFPNGETDNGTMYSNFGVNYYFCRSPENETMIYVSQMYHDRPLADLGIAEVGFISVNRDFFSCGEYQKKIPLGKWKAAGIMLGNEWIPFHGIMKVTKESVTGMAVHDNSGEIFEIENIDFKNATIWVQCQREFVIIWKNVYNGSDTGYLILLKKK